MATYRNTSGLTRNTWALNHPGQGVVITAPGMFHNAFAVVSARQEPHISGWVTVEIPPGHEALPNGGTRFVPRESLRALPSGARRSKAGASKTVEIFVIQGNYGYGWDDEAAEDTLSEARRTLRDYRENAGSMGSHRLITRRVLRSNPDMSVAQAKASGQYRTATRAQRRAGRR